MIYMDLKENYIIFCRRTIFIRTNKKIINEKWFRTYILKLNILFDFREECIFGDLQVKYLY